MSLPLLGLYHLHWTTLTLSDGKSLSCPYFLKFIVNGNTSDGEFLNVTFDDRINRLYTTTTTGTFGNTFGEKTGENKKAFFKLK